MVGCAEQIFDKPQVIIMRCPSPPRSQPPRLHRSPTAVQQRCADCVCLRAAAARPEAPRGDTSRAVAQLVGQEAAGVMPGWILGLKVVN